MTSDTPIETGRSEVGKRSRLREKILFVDDNPELLQGLRRMLRIMRNDWDMTFAVGAKEALEYMEKLCFDVVISDMRMPEIDGAQFLEQTKNICPQSVRIVLSGQADVADIKRAIAPSHQYLSKPCDPDALRGMIVSVLRLRDFLSSDLLKTAVSKSFTLPSQATSVTEFHRLLSSARTDIEKFRQLVCSEGAFAAKVLQLVNSAYFGAKQSICDPRQAVEILGIDLLRALFLDDQLLEDRGNDPKRDAAIARLNVENRLVSKLARRIAQAEHLDESLANDAECAGLLHTIGKLVILDQFPRAYEILLEVSAEEGIPAVVAEKEAFTATSYDAGAYLLGLWGIPERIIRAIADIPAPAKSGLSTFGLESVLHVSRALIDVVCPKPVREINLDVDLITAQGKIQRLSEWTVIAEEVLADEP